MSEDTQISTEKIGTEFEKIGHGAEKIVEIIPEQIRYRGQRGPDKSPRSYNPNSWGNLKQYQNIPAEKLKSNKWIWIILGIVLLIVGIIVAWLLYKRHTSHA